MCTDIMHKYLLIICEIKAPHSHTYFSLIIVVNLLCHSPLLGRRLFISDELHRHEGRELLNVCRAIQHRQQTRTGSCVI